MPLLALATLLPLLTAGFANLGALWRAGPVSVMGAATIVQAVLVVAACVVAARYPRRLLLLALPFGLLLLWAIVRSLLTPPTFEGAQNALVYVLFFAGLVLAGTLAARQPDKTVMRLARGIGWIQVVALAVFAVNIAVWGLPRGGNWWIGPRSFALVALIPFSWHLARWSAGKSASLLVALLWLGIVVATASRTATAIGFVSLAVTIALQAPRRPRRAAVGLATLAGALGIVAALIAFAPPIHARYFRGDTSIRVGKWAINASGRAAFWRVMARSAAEAPLTGHGLGSSQEVMASEFLTSDNIRHPHNDYLRLWHDLGVIGVALLLGSLLIWCAVLLRTWRRNRGNGSRSSISLAALFIVVELTLAMITDNVLIYPFFMGAAGIVIGTALGFPSAFEREAAQTL